MAEGSSISPAHVSTDPFRDADLCRVVVRAHPDSLTLLTMDGRPERMNDQALQALGASPAVEAHDADAD